MKSSASELSHVRLYAVLELGPSSGDAVSRKTQFRMAVQLAPNRNEWWGEDVRGGRLFQDTSENYYTYLSIYLSVLGDIPSFTTTA